MVLEERNVEEKQENSESTDLLGQGRSLAPHGPDSNLDHQQISVWKSDKETCAQTYISIFGVLNTILE